MQKQVPGAPYLLKKLGIRDVGQFILPCIFSHDSKYFFGAEKLRWSTRLSSNDYFTVVTEPYNKINAKVFSVADPYDAHSFLVGLANRLASNKQKNAQCESTNFLGYECRIEDMPPIMERLPRELSKLEEKGHYILEFSRSGSLKKVKKVARRNIENNRDKNSIGVMVVKRSDINEESFERSSTVVNHHSFHTYKEYANGKGIKEILDSSKKLGNVQIINLHRIYRKKPKHPSDMNLKAESLLLSTLRKSIEKVGFDSIYHAEVKRMLGILYDIRLMEIEDSHDIEKIKTGNYRWLILRNNSN